MTTTELESPVVIGVATARRIYEGLDALSDEVRECEKQYGTHHLWFGLLVDIERPELGVITVDICKRCYVRRCTAAVVPSLKPPSTCMWPMNHVQPHMDVMRRERKVGEL